MHLNEFREQSEKIAELLRTLHNPLNTDALETLHELCNATNMQGDNGTLISAAGLNLYLHRLMQGEKASVERQLIVAQMNEGGLH